MTSNFTDFANLLGGSACGSAMTMSLLSTASAGLLAIDRAAIPTNPLPTMSLANHVVGSVPTTDHSTAFPPLRLLQCRCPPERQAVPAAAEAGQSCLRQPQLPVHHLQGTRTRQQIRFQHPHQRNQRVPPEAEASPSAVGRARRRPES